MGGLIMQAPLYICITLPCYCTYGQIYLSIYLFEWVWGWGGGGFPSHSEDLYPEELNKNGLF